MQIETYVRDGVTVIRIEGNLDSNSSPQAEEELMGKIGVNSCLVLDMSGCAYISSAGLRVLTAVGKQLQANQGCWAFAGFSEEVTDVMEMTGFSRFFKIYSDVDEAVGALREKNVTDRSASHA